MLAIIKKIIAFIIIITLIVAMFGIALLYWDYSGLDITKENNLFQNISKTDCSNLPAQEVHINYITDENYIYPTQVSAYSAIKNKCPQSVYYFHIMTDAVDIQKAQAAFAPMESDTVHFEIIPQKRTLDIEFSDYLEHISAAALLKFEIPNALPKVNRVIYMDSDTLVTKDLQTLFTTDLEDNFVGAVSDLGLTAQRPYLASLGYKENVYYNTGVLLLDLEKMRQYEIPQKLNSYLAHSQQLVFLDQDVYNIVLKKHIKTLPYHYNCMAIMHMYARPKLPFFEYAKKRWNNTAANDSVFTRLYAKELPLFYRNIFKDTVILHYFGVTKPWRETSELTSVNLFLDLWHTYANDLEQEFHITKTLVSPTAIKNNKTNP